MNIFVYKINWRVQCLSVYSPWIKPNLLSAVCLFLNVLSQLLLFYYIIYVGKSLVLKTASIVYGWLWLNNFNSFHHILLWRRKLDNNWTMLQVIENNQVEYHYHYSFWFSRKYSYLNRIPMALHFEIYLHVYELHDRAWHCLLSMTANPKYWSFKHINRPCRNRPGFTNGLAPSIPMSKMDPN